MAGIDPTTVRLSDHFLLSDFIGCDSVYRHGYPNPVTDSDGEKVAQGGILAETLDQVFERYGPLSITYGYISPGLSRKIVKYQDPNKPSYHRWDLGAAADIAVHDWVGKAPPVRFVESLCALDTDISFSRIITYSESEILCFAVSGHENPMLDRVYENRYTTGERKPKFIRYPAHNNDKRVKQLKKAAQEVAQSEWRGQGWPSYHGGGRKQFEHHRLGRYTLFSDFLYSPVKVHKGIPNNVDLSPTSVLNHVKAGAAYNDEVQDRLSRRGCRASIVFAIDCNNRPWHDNFVIDYVPSSIVGNALSVFEEAAHALEGSMVCSVSKVRMRKGETRYRVVGEGCGA